MAKRGRIRRAYDLLATSKRGVVTLRADIRTFSKKEAAAIFISEVGNGFSIRCITPGAPKAYPGDWQTTADGKATMRAIARWNKRSEESKAFWEQFSKGVHTPEIENAPHTWPKHDMLSADSCGFKIVANSGNVTLFVLADNKPLCEIGMPNRTAFTLGRTLQVFGESDEAKKARIEQKAATGGE